jgi:Zincin-like metallopeptidase
MEPRVATMRPPKRVHLPTGRVVTLAAKAGLAPRGPAPHAPLFSELVALVASGDLTLRAVTAGTDAAVDVLTLDLRDFHALRAIATRLGWLAEEPVELSCRNCGDPFEVAPCAALELGPFVDGELDDPELDRTLDCSVAHATPAVHLPRGGIAREVRLRPVTAGDAAALHRALRRRRLVVTDRVVRAMGIESLGPEHDPRRIAVALTRASDEAWGAIGDLFLQAHYPLRLSSVALCPKCGARNDVDAPYERELEPSGPTGQSNAEVFPDFDAFDARARAAFDEHVGEDAAVRLVVDEGVPACDDGGEPLMGGYLPAGGDPSAPVGSGEITLYYRTFRAMWEEDGAFDWAAEVDETVAHELEHHDAWRVGHDALDDEERAEIARERERIVGRKAIARQSVGALGSDVAGFLRSTWPIWLIVAVGTVAIAVCNAK